MTTPPDEKDDSAKLPEKTMAEPTARSEQMLLDMHDDDESPDLQSLEEARLVAYANLLDSAIRLPGGFRIGLDGIVGIVPGVGDILGAGLSGYLIYAASKLDIPKTVVLKMMANTGIETFVGMVPVIGDIFDFFYKANNRNAALLHAALEEKKRAAKQND